MTARAYRAPAVLGPPRSWTLQAACADTEPDVMFPASGDASGYRTARDICAACPVRQQCLDDAMAYERNKGKSARYGIRAGLTPAQRAKLYARRRRDASAAA